MRDTKQDAAFAVRGLEFHSSRMWQWAQVEAALEFMHKFGMNTLIFHQNDIVDHLVFPTALFSEEMMWKRHPVRLHSIYQNRHYINKVVREAQRRGVRFCVEIKEIWYVDQVLEAVPGLRNPDGSVCPTNPFWWEFLDMKMRELLEAVPGLHGVIVSPGTRESKVSISTNACTCPRCKATDATDWYTDLLRAMHRPLAEKGKEFAVRDFSYSADQQSRMLTAAKRVSEDIVISLKNTPHDYYPPFPHNPRIGHTGGLRQWIEYDTWGQFFGLGIFPVSVVEDMQERVRHARASGAEGVNLRTDWEVITDSGSFNSPNILNVVAGAMLARDPDVEIDRIYEAWAAHGVYSPLREASAMQGPFVPTAPDAAARLKAFMRASWQVMEKAQYVRGHLFHEDDQYCDTVGKAMDMMVHIHGRDDWEPGASKLLEPTAANLDLIFAEKQQAVSAVDNLEGILQPETLGLPPQVQEDFRVMLELYRLYVRGFELCARATFLSLRAEAEGVQPFADAIRRAAAELRAFGDQVRKRLDGTSYPHVLYWSLDTARSDALAADIEARLAGAAS
jgi:hypothetical protein